MEVVVVVVMEVVVVVMMLGIEMVVMAVKSVAPIVKNGFIFLFKPILSVHTNTCKNTHMQTKKTLTYIYTHRYCI